MTRAELETFPFEGQPLRLIAPQSGIWKPRVLTIALSILTTFTPTTGTPPYDDHVGVDGFPRYKWRGTKPSHSDNVSLRRAIDYAKPLIWLRGVARGIYQPEYPIYLAGEESDQRQFVIALNKDLRDLWDSDLVALLPQNPVRRYAERVTRDRLHQPVFRAQVLIAYRERCALCNLRHARLLDAAHIKPDGDGGEPVVPTVSRCVRSTIARSMRISSLFDRITVSRFALMCVRSRTDRPFDTRCKVCMARRSRFQVEPMNDPVRSCWRSGSSDSAQLDNSPLIALVMHLPPRRQCQVGIGDRFQQPGCYFTRSPRCVHPDRRSRRFELPTAGRWGRSAAPHRVRPNSTHIASTSSTWIVNCTRDPASGGATLAGSMSSRGGSTSRG